jgi:hypothetical protein
MAFSSYVTMAVTIAVLAWLLASRQLVAEREGERSVLAYGRAWRIVTGVLLGFPPAGIVTLFVAFPPKPEDRAIPWMMVAGFLALSIPLSIEIFRVAHRIDETGIERVSPWRRRAFVRWAEVRSLRWSQSSKWFVMEGKDGERVRVSSYLSGLGTFAKLSLAHVPREAIDPETSKQLWMLRDAVVDQTSLVRRP